MPITLDIQSVSAGVLSTVSNNSNFKIALLFGGEVEIKPQL